MKMNQKKNVKISIYDAMSSGNLFSDMHAKWMCHALTPALEQLKLSLSTKSTTVDKFITKHKEAVSKAEFTVK